ncbi:Ubiquitin-conjugating enzyme/RWD-like protein [Metarhizium rileyi]|uniref:Ubiquitin-conjugating enzyme/RWD-like protein n=1 Tax=Metarhizium rileyi (strain RCEF 4871) TaxID=1649241 RepID=A0A167IUU9_METRR|nr:Ubiquitin-conjugating enzyme/RWD-like protein [Metarhizium rileyi RCEF 4871]
MGPHETPYEFGFFEVLHPRMQVAMSDDFLLTVLQKFSIRFSRDYPSKSPNVQCVTTNGGRCRLNPNIYANGKVNIGSLLSANPYENEPGFEDANEESDKVYQKDYIQKIRHESLRISVVQRLENYLGISPFGVSTLIPTKEEGGDDDEEVNVPFEPFKDLCKRRFLWYHQSFLDAIEKGKSEVKLQDNFVRMPFEMPGNNCMEGKFNYQDLERRLNNIKTALDAEPAAWADEGLAAVGKESTVAFNLQHQYEQVTAYFRRCDMPHHVTLENGNPFVWVITYFGRPMTNLDGGLFRIRMNFSPRFPDEQPRVKFETKIFHHHVAPDGTACYVPNQLKREDIKSHIEAIISTLEEDEPAYDPRMIVNPEATKLFWGAGKDDKKQYNRRLRRSVQQSMDSNYWNRDFPE